MSWKAERLEALPDVPEGGSDGSAKNGGLVIEVVDENTPTLL